MSRTLDPSPAIPQEIKDADASGELVVFVGAGVSRLINCPSWDNFTNKVLQQLAPNGLDFYELSQIQRISDPKKRLSLAKIVAEKKNLTIDYSDLRTVESWFWQAEISRVWRFEFLQDLWTTDPRFRKPSPLPSSGSLELTQAHSSLGYAES